MSLTVFKNNLELLRSYADKLERESFPHETQELLMKIYAEDLKINLTPKMISELISSDLLH